MTHAEISACDSAPRTAQSALLPAGAPTDMYATLRANMSPLNNCCGVSKELVVRKLNSPENGAPVNRFAARRKGEPSERLNLVVRPKPPGSASDESSGLNTSPVASCSTLRRR